MAALLNDPLAHALGEVVAQQDRHDAPAESDGEGGADAGTGSRRGRTTPPRAGRAPTPTLHGAASTGTVPRTGRRGPPVALERRALEGAALALLVRSFAPIVHELPLDTLARVLATADPTAAAAALAATLATDLSARATATPLVRAWFESARRKRELLEEAGGGLTAAQVATARGITRQAVERARSEQRLLAVPAAAAAAATAFQPSPLSAGAAAAPPTILSASDWLYPAAQFGPDGQPLAGLAAVLRAFQATHVADPWTQLSELLAPDPEFGDRSIFALLRDQGEAAVPAAVAALREVGAMGA